MNNVEGFVRQLLGWREFIRGMYWRYMPGYASQNAMRHRAEVPTVGTGWQGVGGPEGIGIHRDTGLGGWPDGLITALGALQVMQRAVTFDDVILGIPRRLKLPVHVGGKYEPRPRPVLEKGTLTVKTAAGDLTLTLPETDRDEVEASLGDVTLTE